MDEEGREHTPSVFVFDGGMEIPKFFSYSELKSPRGPSKAARRIQATHSILSTTFPSSALRTLDRGHHDKLLSLTSLAYLETLDAAAR